MTATILDTCWVDTAGTATLQRGVIDPVSSFSRTGADPAIFIVVINTTGDDLDVDEQYLPHGTLVEANEDSIVAVPPEVGVGATAVGVWNATMSGLHRPSLVVKFTACPATDSKPVYVGADLTEHLIFGSNKYTASARNSEHGTAEDYYDNILTDSDEDYAKHHTAEGCVSVVGHHFPYTEVQDGFGNTDDQQSLGEMWVVVATIIDTRHTNTAGRN